MRWIFAMLLFGAVAQSAPAPKSKTNMKDLLPNKEDSLPQEGLPKGELPTRGASDHFYTGRSTQRCEVNGDCEVGWFCDEEKLCARANHPHIEETRPRKTVEDTYQFKGPALPVF